VKVALFGLGYVGCVCAGCFARAGHEVIGVDVNPVKVNILNEGKSPIVEKGVADLLRSGREAGRLRATTSAAEAIAASGISMICVGTPSHANGSLDLRHIHTVAEEIGTALKAISEYHVVVIRSTVMPGTAATVTEILARTSGRRPGEGFGVVVNPEFLREGTAVADFLHPPLTLLGGTDVAALDAVAALYRELEAPLVRATTPVAEMAKYVSNAYHAVKIAFANEIGNVCKASGIDSHAVMDIFCMDEKLNISSKYLKPGFAFGGSCLPKDVRALTFRAREHDLSVPLLESLLPSNALQIRRVVDQLLAWKARKIGVLGLSFKGGTDDLRESPLVEVVETMLGKGYDVRIYDPNVSLARLFGANKEYIQKEIPHIERIMSSSLDEVLEHAEVLIVGNHNDEFRRALESPRPGQRIYDLVRFSETPPDFTGYEGICW
jgi:GDP-mannose 6-dehydrogenase